MRKELGPINARIAAIVNEGSSNDRGTVCGLRWGGEGEQRRDVVGERVARVVGGMQQQQRLALTVSVLGLSQCAVDSSGRSGNETVEVRGYGGFGSVTAESGGGGLVSPLASTVGSPSSAFPPLTPSPSPSPIPSSPVSNQNPTQFSPLSKLRKRVIESRNRLSFHRRWWQRRVNRKQTPRDHILSSCSRRLQRINQRIRIITKKHQILRYDRIAEKYLHWENHLREQMMIRRWGTKKNVELDRERRADLAKLECLRKRRDALVRMISTKAL